jgi:hypothetical protein
VNIVTKSFAKPITNSSYKGITEILNFIILSLVKLNKVDKV